MTTNSITKALVLAGLVSVASQSTQAGTGIYVGAAVGGAAMTGSGNLSISRTVPPLIAQSFNSRVSDKNVMGDIFIGWGKRFNCFYGAIEALGTFTSLNSRHVLDISGTNSQQPLNFKTTNAWGGAVNLGYHINQPTRLYVKLGFESRSFRTNFNGTNNFADPILSASQSKRSTAFVPGLGMETELNHRFSVRAEYRTALHSGKTVSVSTNPTTYTNINAKPTIHYFNVGVTARF